jgi:hypothetical protein
LWDATTGALLAAVVLYAVAGVLVVRSAVLQFKNEDPSWLPQLASIATLCVLGFLVQRFGSRLALVGGALVVFGNSIFWMIGNPENVRILLMPTFLVIISLARAFPALGSRSASGDTPGVRPYRGLPFFIKFVLIPFIVLGVLMGGVLTFLLLKR